MSLYTCTLATGLLSCPTQRCGPNVQPSTEVSDALPARAAGKGQENSNYLWRFSGPRWPLVFNHVEMNSTEVSDALPARAAGEGQENSNYLWRFSGPRWPLVFNHVEMNDEELAPERSFTGPRSGQMASHHVGTSPK
jgi:hypothetical protein